MEIEKEYRSVFDLADRIISRTNELIIDNGCQDKTLLEDVDCISDAMLIEKRRSASQKAIDGRPRASGERPYLSHFAVDEKLKIRFC